MVSGAAIAGKIDPHKEAELIAVESTDSLLPDPKLVDKIQKDVALIRLQHSSVVKNIRNSGRKNLGMLSVKNYTTEVLDTINNNTEFGPAKVDVEASSTNEDGTVLVFDKPYNPDKLAAELKTKLGVSASPIWRTGPDFGHIEYLSETDEYDFRNGLANCLPDCSEIHYWTFKITDGKAEITGEHATDIPEVRTV